MQALNLFKLEFKHDSISLLSRELWLYSQFFFNFNFNVESKHNFSFIIFQFLLIVPKY